MEVYNDRNKRQCLVVVRGWAGEREGGVGLPSHRRVHCRRAGRVRNVVFAEHQLLKIFTLHIS